MKKMAVWEPEEDGWLEALWKPMKKVAVWKPQRRRRRLDQNRRTARSRWLSGSPMKRMAVWKPEEGGCLEA